MKTPNHHRWWSTLLLLGLVSWAVTAGAEPIEADRFGPLAPLIGRWQGYCELPDGSLPGLTERTYSYCLGGMFVRVESTSMFPPALPDTYYDVDHELQLISFDAGTERYLLRGFFSEGYATRETVTFTDDTPPKIVLDSESIENGPAGMRTRHTLILAAEDRLIDRFEIEMPGAGYLTYWTATMRRVSAH